MLMNVNELKELYLNFLVDELGNYTHEFDSFKDSKIKYEHCISCYAGKSWDIVHKKQFLIIFFNKNPYIKNTTDIEDFFEYFNNYSNVILADLLGWNLDLSMSLREILFTMIEDDIFFELGQKVVEKYFSDRTDIINE